MYKKEKVEEIVCCILDLEATSTAPDIVAN